MGQWRAYNGLTHRIREDTWGSGSGGVKQLSSARVRGGLAVVGKHVCSDGGLISTPPEPRFGHRSISPRSPLDSWEHVSGAKRRTSVSDIDWKSSFFWVWWTQEQRDTITVKEWRYSMSLCWWRPKSHPYTGRTSPIYQSWHRVLPLLRHSRRWVEYSTLLYSTCLLLLWE